MNGRTPPKLGSYWEINPICPRDFPRFDGARIQYLAIHYNTSLAEPVATKYDHLHVLPIFARCRYEILEKSPLARRRSGTMSGQYPTYKAFLPSDIDVTMTRL